MEKQPSYSGKTLIRAFVAVSVPNPAAEILKDYVNSLKKLGNLRWVTNANFHMTLRFIGEQTPECIAAIRQALTHIEFSPFEIELSYAGAFPNMSRPRALWLSGRQGMQNLKLLAENVNKHIDATGLSQDGRAFKPHLTLARSDGTPLTNTLTKALENAPRVHWLCDTIHLIRSVLTPHGAQYSPIQSYRLEPVNNS
ncbi:MAG: RNA 2',3'-cyclic phosphodiesterase [Desulfovibrionaceae bacterium]|nr:RNA 2',3'-cyclic phosphodiesterase [Desulfovibrionaceae bacterium]